MSKLLRIILLVLFNIPLALLGGVVLHDFWTWFITPVFGGPTLSVMQAIGINLVVGYFKIGLQGVEIDGAKDDPITTDFIRVVGYTVVYLTMWGTGAVWHLFI